MASDDSDTGTDGDTGTDTSADNGTGSDAPAGNGTVGGTGAGSGTGAGGGTRSGAAEQAVGNGRAARAGGIDPSLAELADVYGVATRYIDADDQEVTVDPRVVRAVLGLLDVDTADPAAALAAARDAPWRRPLPACVIVRRSAPTPVIVRVPAGTVPVAELELADGGRRDLTGWGETVGQRLVDGQELLGVPLELPAGLPLGDHVLRLRAGAVVATAELVVVPDAVPGPAGAVPGRAWGWMIQLYALRSAGSWGMGDYADLAGLAAWSGGEEGGRADVLLVNPLHAAAPTFPVEPSPYFPASRRFASPLYLRPQDLPEYARADAATRARVDQLATIARAGAATPPSADGPRDGGLTDAGPREGGLADAGPGRDEAGEAGSGVDRVGLLDRDAVWQAKLAGLELLFRVSRPGPADEPADEPAAGHDGLTDFATWCALAERHGPDWRHWPAHLRDPR
ncbi:4-alpha-glucanotransferase, partial [Frankia sp. CiP1_Cm_nod1]